MRPGPYTVCGYHWTKSLHGSVPSASLSNRQAQSPFISHSPPPPHNLSHPQGKLVVRLCWSVCSYLVSLQKAQAEVEGLGKGVARLSAEAEKVLALPEPSPAAPTLRSELELTLGKLEQVRSLSAIYLEK